MRYLLVIICAGVLSLVSCSKFGKNKEEKSSYLQEVVLEDGSVVTDFIVPDNEKKTFCSPKNQDSFREKNIGTKIHMIKS